MTCIRYSDVLERAYTKGNVPQRKCAFDLWICSHYSIDIGALTKKLESL